MSVRFVDCHVSNNGWSAISIEPNYQDAANTVHGNVTFEACTVANVGLHGARINLPTSNPIKVVFDDCVWENVGTSGARPLYFRTQPIQSVNSGVDFIDCAVYDNGNRQFAWIEVVGGTATADLEGSITVYNPNVVQTPAWLIPNLTVIYNP